MKKLSRIILMLFLGFFVMAGTVSNNTVNVDAAKKTTVTSTKKKTVSKKSSKKKTTVSSKKKKTVSKKSSSKKLKTKVTNWKIKNIKGLKGIVDQDIIDGFKELGFKVTVDRKEADRYGYAGCFSPSRSKIILREGDTETLLHEMGHFVDMVMSYPSSSKEFTKVYKAEKNKAKTFYYVPSYTTTVAKEYFAESFNEFYSNPATLKAKCPKTYKYMKNIIKEFSDEEVQYTKNRYGFY